jgi:phosphonate transport system permease protein
MKQQRSRGTPPSGGSGVRSRVAPLRRFGRAEPGRAYLRPPSVQAGLTDPATITRAAIFVAVIVLAWLVWDTGADPVRLARGVPWILDFIRRMLPPDLRVLPAALLGALKTVEIALLGTAVAAVLALPLGFLSARNVAPGAVFYPARAVLNFFRSVDTLVYALVFVAAVGLGPFPGVLAVVAYTTTSLAKLYSEAVEGIDPGPVDAIRATGATRLQILRFGVMPQILPLFLSYVLYRLESNIRAATVLGFVGAGGIGFYLQTYLRMIDYPAASTVLLVTVAMVMVVDAISSRLRDRLV